MNKTTLDGTNKHCNTHMHLHFMHSCAYRSMCHHQIQTKMLRLLVLR